MADHDARTVLSRLAAGGLALFLVMGASAAGCEYQQRLAKCEKAFRKEYRRAQQDQDDGHKPRECRGIAKPALKRIAAKVIREETEKLPSGEDG